MVKERIAITNELSETEMLKTLAKNGKDNLGLRFMNPIEFANRVLLENGVIVDKELLTVGQANAIYYKNLVLNDNTFKHSKSYEDAAFLNKSINSLRYFILDDESNIIKNTIKSDKWNDMFDLFNKYNNYKEENNFIDNIDLLREAIKYAKPKEYEIIILDEFPLQPLEEQLITKCVNYKKMSMCDLFETSASKNGSNNKLVDEFVKVYGNSNQIEYIINYLNTNKIEYDKVNIIDNGGRFYLDIINTLEKYNIPYTSAYGTNINGSNVANFLKKYYIWKDNYGYSVRGAIELFNSRFFNKVKLYNIVFNDEYDDKKYLHLLKLCGNLRLSDNDDNLIKINKFKDSLNKYNNLLNKIKDENSITDEDELNYFFTSKKEDNDYNSDPLRELLYIEPLNRLANVLNKGIVKLIDDFCIDRKDKFQYDSSSKSLVINKINEFLKIVGNADSTLLPQLIGYIYNHSSIDKKESKPASIHVCSPKQALNTLREYNFFIGLDSSFPSPLKENYLIYDDEYLAFSNNKNIPTSRNIMNFSKDEYKDSIKILSTLNKHNFLIYSYYNDTEIKKYNFSSLMFEIYQQMNNDADIKTFDKLLESNVFGFEDSKVSKDTKLIKNYNANAYEVAIKRKELKSNYDDFFNKRKYKPSVLKTFFSCPLSFYFGSVLGLNINEYSEQFSFLEANEYGLMCHDILLYYVKFLKYGMTFEKYKEYANTKYESYASGHNCFNSSLKTNTENKFNTFVSSSFKKLESIKAKEILAEKSIKGVFPYKEGKEIAIGGRFDRVDIIDVKDGKKIANVIDYKTGKTAANFNLKKDDISELGEIIETMVYSYLLEKDGNMIVNENTYMYVTQDEEVSCEYEKLRSLFDLGMTAIGESLESGKFEMKENRSKCKYCKFTSICKEFKKEG